MVGDKGKADMVNKCDQNTRQEAWDNLDQIIEIMGKWQSEVLLVSKNSYSC